VETSPEIHEVNEIHKNIIELSIWETGQKQLGNLVKTRLICSDQVQKQDVSSFLVKHSHKQTVTLQYLFNWSQISEYAWQTPSK